MKILLLGEYSRLHLTLAEGLRAMGLDVTLASDGDSFKDYERDIDLTRKSSSLKDTFSCLRDTLKKFSKFKGYDIVQIINPCFTTLNVEVNRYLYRQLKKNNDRVFLGAFGDDSYWVRACMSNKVFRYCEFWVDDKSTNLAYNKRLEETWIGSRRDSLNSEIANSCDGIIACLYEYYASYQAQHAYKLEYIPLPINTTLIDFQPITKAPDKLKIFIGINKDRSEYKGTDIMEDALLDVAKRYPNEVSVIRAESVEYKEYQRLMEQSHIVLDQLYSYTPSMNALLAMAQGKILVGGGEPETYQLLSEKENHPIINVHPTKEDVIRKLEDLINNKERIVELSMASRQFVDEHHSFMQVARQYFNFWTKK